MYVLSWRTVSALNRVLILVDINTKITLPWTLKQFATRVHNYSLYIQTTVEMFRNPTITDTIMYKYS